MSIDHRTRLVAYAPNGDRLGVLPHPLDWSATLPHAELGAASLRYSRITAGGPILQRRLTDGLEIALEEWNGAKWVEPASARFVAVERGSDPSDKTDTVTITAPAYGWLLSKIKHAAPTESLYASDGDNKGRRQFLGVTAGTVIATLLDEYQERGGPRIERDFTTQTDSEGRPWPSLNSFWVSRGEALDVTLDRLADRGDIDWHFQGRTLVVTPTQPGRDQASEIVLHVGRQISEAPSEETIADLITAHTVHGGEGLIVTDADSTAPSPWGRWEGFASDDRITTEGGARARNQQVLRDSARLRGQYTRDLTPLCQWRLGIDITAGDWITAPTWRAGERVRVASTLWRGGADGVTRSLILNDSLLDRELRRLRKERLGESGGADGSGTTIQPALDGTDKRAPAAPTGLSLTTVAYLDPYGMAQGLVETTWDAVSTARVSDGGGAMEIGSYDVAVRRSVDGAPWSIVRTSDELRAELAPYPVGETIEVRVRARGLYAPTPGDWSAPVAISVADDVTPPPTPSMLTVSSSRGLVILTWDGKSDLDADGMPQDFEALDVAFGLDREPTELVGYMYQPGDRVHLADLPYGEVFWVRSRARDKSGNVSEWSAPVQVSVTSEIDGGRVNVDYRPPTADDATGKPEGAIWQYYDVTEDPTRPELRAFYLLRDGVWVETPLTTTLVTKIDIGQGTYGMLDGHRINVRSLTADRIDSASYRGEVIDGATIIIRDSTDPMAENITLGNRTLTVSRSDGEGGLVPTLSIGGSTSDEISLRPVGAAWPTVQMYGDTGDAGFAGTVNTGDLFVGGENIHRMLKRLPQPMLGAILTSRNPGWRNNTVGQPLGRLKGVSLESGRMLKLSFSGAIYATTYPLTGVWSVYHKVGGQDITAANGTLRWRSYRTAVGPGVSGDWSIMMHTTETHSNHQFLVTLDADTSKGNISIQTPGEQSGWSLLLEDLGAREYIAGDTYAIGVDGSATIASSASRQTARFKAVGIRSWFGSSIRTSELGHGVWGGTRRYSQILFGPEVKATLAGATNISARVRMRNVWTYSPAQPANVYLSAGTQTALAASAATSPVGSAVSWKRGASEFAPVPGWNASSQSVWLGIGAGTGVGDYAKFSPDLREIELEVSFDKLPPTLNHQPAPPRSVGGVPHTRKEPAMHDSEPLIDDQPDPTEGPTATADGVDVTILEGDDQ